MKKIIDPFIDFLPSIDLHGMDRVCARIKTEEFINDSIKLKNKRVVIIHGIGQGIVKDEVYKCLKRNKNVIHSRQETGIHYYFPINKGYRSQCIRITECSHWSIRRRI